MTCPNCGDRLAETIVIEKDEVLFIDRALCVRPMCRTQVPRELCRAAEPQWLAKQWALMQEVLQWPRQLDS